MYCYCNSSHCQSIARWILSATSSVGLAPATSQNSSLRHGNKRKTHAKGKQYSLDNDNDNDNVNDNVTIHS